MMPRTTRTGRGRSAAPSASPSGRAANADAGADAALPPPPSPGALYEAERAARIAANEVRMAQVLESKPAGLKRAASASVKAAPPKKRSAAVKPDPDAPPPRRSTRDRRPKPPGVRRRRTRAARLSDDEDEEDDANGDAPYSPGLTREERLARLEAGEGAAPHDWEPWAAAVPALAQRGGSLNKALLADADEVRALSQYRADKMTLKAVANRVDKLTNLTKLEDFIPVLRAKAASRLAEGDAEEALEYDRVAGMAAAKLARMTAERE